MREILPEIASKLRKQFDLPLSEAIELAKIWQHGECDEELPAEEIEQIVRRVYSAPSGSTAKRYSSKLEAALDHARRGFRVLPLVPNGKEAAIKKWQYAATSDQERICQWFEENPATISESLWTAICGGHGWTQGRIRDLPGAVASRESSEHATLTAVTASGSHH